MRATFANVRLPLLLVWVLLVTGCMSLPGSDGPQLDEARSVDAQDLDPQVLVDASIDRFVEPVAPEVQAQFDEGLRLLDAGETEQAQKVFARITSRHPELAGPWANLGFIKSARGQTSDAMQDFEAALRADPHQCDVNVYLGLKARQQGDFVKAEEYYLACIEGSSNHAGAYKNLAIVYELYMGRLNDALDAYAHYQELQTKPDVQVAGWMVDLERRIGAIAKR